MTIDGASIASAFLNTEEGRPSLLIRQVRKQPFVVVLLDEIKKATTQVFDIMLGLLDEGRGLPIAKGGPLTSAAPSSS